MEIRLDGSESETRDNAVASTSKVDDPKPSTSNEVHLVPSASEIRDVEFSPEFVRPLPKAGHRKQSQRGRKMRYAAILTDTSEKLAIEQESQKKSIKSRKMPTKGASLQIRKHMG